MRQEGVEVPLRQEAVHTASSSDEITTLQSSGAILEKSLHMLHRAVERVILPVQAAMCSREGLQWTCSLLRLIVHIPVMWYKLICTE